MFIGGLKPNSDLAFAVPTGERRGVAGIAHTCADSITVIEQGPDQGVFQVTQT